MWRYAYVILTSMSVFEGAMSKDLVPCEEARLKCAYRTGCGSALQNYMMSCSALIHGSHPSVICPESCQHALIALTSTEEGKDLMTCECSDNYCFESKQRVEVCRPQVLIANKNETVVSCRVAQWICAADALCTTALDYYNRFCRLMFHGKKCTHRCMNSISILRRQDKAAKLNSCKCDGFEDYDCPQIQSNMAKLCFHKKDPIDPILGSGDPETNVIVDQVTISSANILNGYNIIWTLLISIIISSAVT